MLHFLFSQGQAEMGNAVQGLSGQRGQLHELAGEGVLECPKALMRLTCGFTDSQLANTEEWQNDQSAGSLGEVFIR